MENCLFCKIVKGEIPSDKVYEDEEIMAFRDINPATPIHILINQKKHIESLTKIKEDDEALIGRIYTVINKIAKEQGFIENGYRIITNCGKDGGQEAKHLRYHFLAGKKLGAKIVHD